MQTRHAILLLASSLSLVLLLIINSLMMNNSNNIQNNDHPLSFSSPSTLNPSSIKVRPGEQSPTTNNNNPLHHRNQDEPLSSPEVMMSSNKKLNRLLTLGVRTKFKNSLLPNQNCQHHVDHCFFSNGTTGACPHHRYNIPCGFFFEGQTTSSSSPLQSCASLLESSTIDDKIDFEKDIVPAAEKLLLSTKTANNEKEVRKVFSSACRWTRPKDPKIWKTGGTLREKYPNAAKYANECSLPSSASSLALTTHHLHQTLPTSTFKSKLFSKERGVSFSSPSSSTSKFLFEEDEKKQKNKDEVKMNMINKKEDSSRITVTKPKSKHQRFARASWISLRNMCMSCEASSSSSSSGLTGIMNPKKKMKKIINTNNNNNNNNNNHLTPCYPHLWPHEDTDADSLKRLFSKSRGGRHSIFLQREASFVTGGVLKASDFESATTGNNNNNNNNKMMIKRVSGTTWFLPSFSVGNVGHIIHDAVLGFAGSIFARDFYQKADSDNNKKNNHNLETSGGKTSSSLVEKPWRMMIENDLFESSGEFYATLTTMLADYAKEKLEIEPFFFEDDSFVTRNGISDRNKKLLCFDHLILSGTDRTGTGSKFVSKRVVSILVREAAFWYLKKEDHDSGLAVGSELRSDDDDQKNREKEQQTPLVNIFVYGRSDLYRRSIDNFGNLIHHAVAGLNKKFISSRIINVVTTFYSSPPSQISLASQMDILITAQGAHEQIVSLFGPQHQTIIEICPCQGTQTSFVGKYGMFLSSSSSSGSNHQRLLQMQVCSPMINFAEDDVTEQNLTLCPHHFKKLEEMLSEEVERILKVKKGEMKKRRKSMK